MIGTGLTTNCGDCGMLFPAGQGRKFCRPCNIKHVKAGDRRRRLARRQPKWCLSCGTVLGPEYLPQARCCGPCRETMNALRREMRTGPMFRQIIGDRDKWTCGICREVVEPAEASIDHVVSLTRGGTNDLANLQIAHLSCNFIKGVGHPAFATDHGSSERPADG